MNVQDYLCKKNTHLEKLKKQELSFIKENSCFRKGNKVEVIDILSPHYLSYGLITDIEILNDDFLYHVEFKKKSKLNHNIYFFYIETFKTHQLKRKINL